MMTEEQIRIGIDRLLPGAAWTNAATYSDLVATWTDSEPVPSESAIEVAYWDALVELGRQDIDDKATELIEAVTGDTKAQLNALMGFCLEIRQWLIAHEAENATDQATAMGGIDGLYNALVPPIVAVQTKQAELKMALTTSNVGDLDVEAGTIAGVVTSGWPA